MLRFKLLTVLFALAVALVSCHDEKQPPIDEIIPVVQELPVVTMPYNQNDDYLPLTDDQEVIVCNSDEDVIKYNTMSFLQKNPDYLKVNFNRYTLLIRRTVLLDGDMLNRVDTKVVRFIRDDKDVFNGYYGIKYTYIYNKKGVSRDSNKYSWVCQSAVVVDKLPSDAQFCVSEEKLSE